MQENLELGISWPIASSFSSADKRQRAGRRTAGPAISPVRLSRAGIRATRSRGRMFTMADGNGNGSQADAAPAINAMVQYTKDFSFENPNAPRSLGPQEKSPNISIQVNVNARQVAETDFEVNILLEGSAGENADLLFKFELDYAGLFRLLNIAPNDMHPVVMIECPRLLFPFARQIIAEAVRSGGFPPLYIDPIDFAALYRKRLSEMAVTEPTSSA
jgi:preprotein translocase subunit SecB